MPTLNWIGKEKVINHHQEVPYKILEKQYTFADGMEDKTASSKNKIVHGDNLEALKSLLPQYEGKIDCIYIDPPYNTGEENWAYNDNVNHPKIKKWLGDTVGKEGEDLSRHDKWLCMMYPRVKLLRKLLSEKGTIFISIDDNEQTNLKLLCDEIFGVGNFVANILWQKRTSPDARINLGAAHDFILCYSKNLSVAKSYLNKIPYSEERAKSYKNTDNDKRGPWASVDLTGQIGHATESQFYDIVSPNGKNISPPKNRCWAFSKNTILELIEDNRIWFGKDGNSKPRLKKFLSESEGSMAWTWWTNKEVGHNQEATKELANIITEQYFETPKPIRLIDRIIRLATSPDSIILDSFAGSGTTAHAVLNLNKEDGGNRKFILVEMEDYADTITAERIKRVMKGYGKGKKKVEGTDGDFSYYELGHPMFLETNMLNEAVGIEKINEYVWYTETKETYRPQKENYLLGKKNNTAYYFYYEKDRLTVLDESYLRALQTKAHQYIIYADLCLLEEALMDKYHIVFKKIPRDITRF